MQQPGGVKNQAVTFLTFNDVYQLKSRSREPVGGVARFATVLARERQAAIDRGEDVIVTFQGDALSPSLLSTVTKGEQMVPVLNMLGVDVSVLGNHDLDHGVQTTQEMIARMNHPWIISNCIEKATGRPLGGLDSICILKRAGLRIGFIGLIEDAWLATLSHVAPEDVEYEPFVDAARRLNKKMREKHRCDVVVALTHMRVPNDRRLAEEVPELDLILGGHDHDVFQEKTRGLWVVKSGTDFRNLSRVTMRRSTVEERRARRRAGKPARKFVCDVELLDVTAAAEEDAAMAALVQYYEGDLDRRMNKVIGYLGTDLDARFGMIRTRETNSGNLIADMVRRDLHAEVAIVNCGSLRADCVFPAGTFSLRDLHRLLPFMSLVTKVRMTAEQLLATLENAVAKYPALEGRFAAVSGLRFQFDPTRPAGRRVVPGSVFVLGRALKAGDSFTVAIPGYLRGGKDGFTACAEAQSAMQLFDGHVMPVMLRNLFRSLAVLNGFSRFTRRSGRGPAAAAAAAKAAAGAGGAEDEMDSDPETNHPRASEVGVARLMSRSMRHHLRDAAARAVRSASGRALMDDDDGEGDDDSQDAGAEGGASDDDEDEEEEEEEQGRSRPMEVSVDWSKLSPEEEAELVSDAGLAVPLSHATPSGARAYGVAPQVQGRIVCKPRSANAGAALHVLAVFGSGGHTAEMLALLAALPQGNFRRRSYVLAETDHTSRPRAEAAGVVGRGGLEETWLTIPRSREVAQSWASSALSTASASVAAVRCVVAAKPDLVLVNGPGTCVPVVFGASLMRFLGMAPQLRIVFVESICRVQSLSLTGRIVWWLADRFLVQWPELHRQLAVGDPAACELVAGLL